MLDSYLPTFFLTVLYLLSIWLGNKYMKNRHALSLRGILTLYNLGITLLSLYMLAELLLSSWEGGYNLQCQDLTSAGEADVRVAKVLWWYYFSKSIEFLDTIFFVLRKKTSQITFLHVYHHASMFNIWWCVLNWIPCGQSFFGPTLNSFIHILMYSYYGLSVFPSMHKYLWWKKYLTQAQLVQFVLTITHTMSAVVKPCGFPLGCLIFQSSYMLTLVILFLNFYAQVSDRSVSSGKTECRALALTAGLRLLIESGSTYLWGTEAQTPAPLTLFPASSSWMATTAVAQRALYSSLMKSHVWFMCLHRAAKVFYVEAANLFEWRRTQAQ
ncbi:unnamed protein product [Nyctereutes procyonoides]|uniref:Elongation of very long chain fatty acids protein n=1 Tax=Nyctereutes procyonoides TaxID=34880 RepID=A0A811Y8K5_NYCPR|nr:unnamed protein product [Nyctereutes procyonoides]